MQLVGALGEPTRSRVDGRGRMELEDMTVDWWIGADDRWHIPAEEPSVRQVRLGPAPVYETRARVPAGDAVQRVCGVSGRGAPVVVEVENDSPAPFAWALVMDIARGEVVLDGAVLRVDGVRRVAFSPAPRLWATGDDLRTVVTTGAATAEGARSWRAPVALAVLVPVSHRTTARAAFGDGVVDARTLPDTDAIVRGWNRQLDRGLRTELPDELQRQVDAARADLLLVPPDARVAATLEDWGFDAEFEVAWAHLGFLARRAARRRVSIVDPWATVQASPPGLDLLEAVRAVLVRETADHVDVLPGFPGEWRGLNMAVHEIPLRSGGTLSYAVRWHGDRPALLWDAPVGVELRAPIIDPGWCAPGGAGEALLS